MSTTTPPPNQPPAKPAAQQAIAGRLRPSTLAAMRQMMQTYGGR